MERGLLLILSTVAVFTIESKAWNLHTNIAEVEPGSTKNIQLTCTQEEGSVNSSMKVIRIRITKANVFCSKITFAEVYVSTNVTSKEDDDVVISSNIRSGHTVFLKVTWPIATKRTAGAYGCEIEGYTQDDNVQVVTVGPNLIREKVFTRNDANKLISSATADLVRNQRALELEILDLKAHLNDSIASAKEQCQKDINKSRTEISDLRQRTESEYITKDELSVNAYNLMNSTTVQLHELRLEKEKEHQQIDSLVQNLTRDLKRTISTLRREWKESDENLTSRIKEHESDYKRASRQFSEELAKLNHLLKSVHKKYENITDDLLNIVNNKDKLCPTLTIPIRSPTQPFLPNSNSTRMTASTATSQATSKITTTDSTPPSCNSRRWPDTPFVLVKPASGCTRHEPGKMAASVKTIPYAAFLATPDDNQADISRLLDIKVQNGYSKRLLEFCSVGNSLFDTAREAWPKGRYCIIQQEKCPEHFQSGQMHYFVSSKDQDMGFYRFPFCCRGDGPAESPIYLPCEESFYLYRYAGVCQKVAGMDAMTAYVIVDEMDDVRVSVYQSGHSPDVDSNKKFTHLCYYRRTAGS